MKLGDMVVRTMDIPPGWREKISLKTLAGWVGTTGVVVEVDLEYGHNETIPGTPSGFYKVVWQDGGSSWYRSNQVEVISEGN